MNISFAVIAALAMSLAGCTTLHVFQGNSANLAKELRRGENVVVHQKSGRAVQLRYQQIKDNALEGRQRGKVIVTIPLASIDHITTERVDGVRTSLLVIGVAASAAVVVSTIEAAGAGSIMNAAN